MQNGRDEEKRSLEWRAVVIVSSVLIVAIVAFFAIRLFVSNPLEGTWNSLDGDLMMTVNGDETVLIDYPGEANDQQVTMTYTLDRNSKIFSLHATEGYDYEVLSTADDEESSASSLEGTYEYNIEQSQLTLTEREYGDQIVFNKE